MKILLIGPIPPPVDGCSYANKTFYQELLARGVDCDVINTNTAVISVEQGSRFSVKKALGFIGNYSTINKIFHHDVVYFTPGQTFYGILKYSPFILLCIMAKKPFVIHVHGNFIGTQYRALTGAKKKVFHFLISNASAGIVLTETLRKNFEGLLPEEKVFVIENFVDDDLQHFDIKKPSDKLHLLYLSNLMQEKGILEFLDALIMLDSEGVNFDAILGGSIEKGLNEEIADRLNHLNGKARHLGTIHGEEKVKRLCNANVFVLPTYYTMEGLPISLLEAMATGNIVITTKHAGIPDVVNEKNGFLVETRSADEIKRAMKTIDADLPGYIDRISAHNIEYARENFSKRKFTDKILSVLQSTIKAIDYH